MATALISFGSNLGERQQSLQAAAALLAEHPQITALSVSDWQATAPVGGPSHQDEFLNGAARLETSLAPAALLAELQRIERQLGRVREERWAARTLDLDLLLFDELTLNTKDLVLPHPRMAYRRFVLQSAAQVAPDMRHPGIGWTVSRLLKHLNESPPQIAFSGVDAPDRAALAERVGRQAGARVICPDDQHWLRSHLQDRQTLAPEVDKWREVVREEMMHQTRRGAAGLLINSHWLEQAREMAGQSFDCPAVKLVVLFDEPIERIESRLNWSELSNNADLRETLRLHHDKLRALATRPKRGPWLIIDPSDPDWAMEEVLAAARACM